MQHTRYWGPKLCGRPSPEVKPPPWTHTITGSRPAVGVLVEEVEEVGVKLEELVEGT